MPRPWFWLRGNEGAGRALAGVRREAGLTQAQLAELAGMDRTTLLNMEAGRNPAVIRFVEIFGRLPKLRYRQEFAEERGEGALGLSIPLPVTRKPYSGELVDFWMEGLLPEGETRTVLERYFRVRRGDGFALLAALGRDCAGAVAVVPPGETPADPGTVAPCSVSSRGRRSRQVAPAAPAGCGRGGAGITGRVAVQAPAGGDG